MEQNNQNNNNNRNNRSGGNVPGGVVGPTGRRLHVAHRRSPSELTPLVSVLSQAGNGQVQGLDPNIIQQQIDLLSQQNTHLFNTMGSFSTGPQMAGMTSTAFQFPAAQYGAQNPLMQIPGQQLQQQQQQQQHQGGHAHRRNQSAMPNMIPGPPPAPSSGASGSTFGNFDGNGGQVGQPHQGHQGASRGRGGGAAGGGHHRRHSLALTDAKKAAEIAQQKRTTSSFQFPGPGAASESAGGESPAVVSGTPVSGDESSSGTPSQGGLAPLPTMPSRGRGAHGRSQSMAVGRGGGSIGRGGMGNFQSDSIGGSHEFQQQRRGGGSHARTSSRNFDGNWRQNPGGGQEGIPGQQQQQQQQQPQQPPQLAQQSQQGFQPGHRTRASVSGQSMGSIGAFQYPGQPQMVLPGQIPGQIPGQLPGQIFPGIFPNQQMGQINPLALNQLQALQAAQLTNYNNQLAGLSNKMQVPQGHQQNQQQGQGGGQSGRKSLFAPYLPQGMLPELLEKGRVVFGTLRVNKKNRSDAYVTVPDHVLDADIFICGSKDRNRALEGDIVAVELLDVDEVWSQKREKEDKKKRKDIVSSGTSNAGASNGGDDNNSAAEGGLRRRGSLRQRPTQKKNDDVEVEGQSLLLIEEEEINDEQKPLFAGHVVAIHERASGQTFSGTLGLLRPSSQATKDKQDAGRPNNGGHRHTNTRNNNRHEDEKPKIVWFKPTDKRVPLIAIPTEQAPRGFVDNHHEYADRIFVAGIKRWPITSLHPFGNLLEQLGPMGDDRVETDALLRDNNFPSETFPDAVLKAEAELDWTIESEAEEALAARRDFREKKTFSFDLNGTSELGNAVHVHRDDANQWIEVGIHVPDIAHFVKEGSVIDREAKKRGTAVHLLDRHCALLPPKIASDLCSLVPGKDRLTVSVVFKINVNSMSVIEEETYVGRGIIKSGAKITIDEINDALDEPTGFKMEGLEAADIAVLDVITNKLRETRLNVTDEAVTPLRLLHQLEDENLPIQRNVFESTPAVELVEELVHQANSQVAQILAKGLPSHAVLRRQSMPNHHRADKIRERLLALGFDIDCRSGAGLQNSLFKIQDPEIRKGIEAIMIKAMKHAKYFVAGKLDNNLWQHFGLNLSVYTHFAAPTRRYIDVLVHRQLEHVLAGTEYNPEIEAFNTYIEGCNAKVESAQNAQEQSVHIDACRRMDKKRQEANGDLVTEGIVLCVYESAFDVLIPEWGVEKRVHCDQLPLKKAEFRKTPDRVLELYWEKGVPSSAYVPEDERPRAAAASSIRINNAAAAEAARREEADRERKEREEAARKQIDTGTISTDDTAALFDDDDEDEEDNASDITEAMAGASLSGPAARSDSSSTPSWLEVSKDGSSESARANAGDAATPAASTTPDVPESRLSAEKQRYLSLLTLREENGEYIQDVREMTRVPIILKTDLTKSPPCLTVRSVNPYAL
ncbi:cell wall biogenesis protein phosphatase [Ophiostoma piceae UAMH 11346]|uniref:Cell wall biogenesis protein phosphatase n=1 Tax=Ophiostoma piceae (strain UAMH 11346) TaxID=1262450 RepID=S3C0Y9_OPHP1|nr:cell wall biogenesis protein phosphatase [Ophiostoma piceae UAMH 11346]